nr:MAG TPA: hypothetical protein [Caudoviricetes sp.]
MPPCRVLFLCPRGIGGRSLLPPPNGKIKANVL